MKKIFWIILGFALSCWPNKTLAQATAETDFGSFRDMGAYMSAIFAWATPILGTLSILMVVYAGYIYMTSQGSQDKISLAKEIIIGVIIGLLVYFTAGILIRNVIGS